MLAILCILLVCFIGCSLELFWLGLSVNKHKSEKVEAKIKEVCLQYVNKYNIPIFYRETIIADGVACYGLYTCRIKNRIWQHALKIELTNDSRVWTFAHEIGHDICYRKGIESTEENANIEAYKFIVASLSPIEKQVVSISLSCWFKRAYKEIKIKDIFKKKVA